MICCGSTQANADMRDLLGHIWQQLTDWLDVGLFTLGDKPVTTAGLLRVTVILLAAWLASRVLRTALARVTAHWPGMTPSSVYAFGRVLHYALIALGLAVGLSSIGLNLTNFALLLGALGVGIGFGLQSMVANFFAGLIILFERHLKIGDFVELESGVTGEVREIRMRATRITTNDNIDILVPNSEFVSGRVTNWTLDEAYRRIRVPFGVAYGSDKERVRGAVLEAAKRVPHTLTGIPGRDPLVLLVNFGDSSLDFELVVWLTPEAVKRPALVAAAYLWEIHTALCENNIEIPFPQRDLHFRSVLGLKDDQARTWLDRHAPPSG
jgi:small-conductance mechanosensitive channel